MPLAGLVQIFKFIFHDEGLPVTSSLAVLTCFLQLVFASGFGASPAGQSRIKMAAKRDKEHDFNRSLAGC